MRFKNVDSDKIRMEECEEKRNFTCNGIIVVNAEELLEHLETMKRDAAKTQSVGVMHYGVTAWAGQQECVAGLSVKE